ncbi:MAG: Na+/H+ antiporter NhaC [Oligoflexales bacterium]
MNIPIQPQSSIKLSTAFAPVLVLISLLIFNALVFKDGATLGPNQLALLFTGIFTLAIGTLFLKIPYRVFEEEIIKSIGYAVPAFIILLMVGSLISLWIASGVVPSMIFYGLKLINPNLFLPTSCLLCALVALATGSSWSTTGTVGISLIGIGITLGISEGMTAGAVISGAYFGDKMSPLSDTTNMAPAMAGTDIFTHIKHMTYTSIPAILLSLLGFSILGLSTGASQTSQSQIDLVAYTITENFNIGLHLFIIPAIVILLITQKVPAFPALTVGVLLSAIAVPFFQPELLNKVLANKPHDFASKYQYLVSIAYKGFVINSGHEMVDTLFSRGGMAGMLNTIWLIMCAMIFGGCLDAAGILEKIANSILKMVSGAGSLVGATVGSCLTLNMTASDQYLAIVVPGRMFKEAYEKYGLHPKNLSRSLEDAGTVTSVLVPWNSGGAYNSSVLGVPTLTYLPYCFFNLLSPLISIFLASMNLTIEKSISMEKERFAPSAPILAKRYNKGKQTSIDLRT